ncbi:hypothetical protein [Acidaminobacterium chupaoyuni]
MKKTAARKTRSWHYELLILTEFLAVLWVCWQLSQNPAVSLAACALLYGVFGVVFRFTFQRHHRKGLRLYGKGDYRGALGAFEESERFSHAHPLIDRFRFFSMLDPSRLSYWEMAIANQAACYGHMGRGEEAMECYRRIEKREDQTGR